MGRKWYAQMRLGKYVIRNEGPFPARQGAVEALDGLERFVVNSNWLEALESNRRAG